jgi:DNA invertase Pin-like site-specific DNA recombinase
MTSHVIAYSRVSTVDQHTEPQQDKLNAYAEKHGMKIDRVFMEKITGTKASRPEWDDCRDHLREGDTLLVTKLDRLGRSTKDLLEISTWLNSNGINLVCTDQPVDTTTPEGRLFFTLIAAFAEFERDMMVARTHDGLAAARARGRKGGRKESVTPAQKKEIFRLHALGDLTVQQIADMHKISRGTVYNVLSAAKAG